MTLYLVFRYNLYYPSGGMGDCKGVYTDPSAAWERVQAMINDNNDPFTTFETEYLEIYGFRPDGTWYCAWDRQWTPEQNAPFLALVGRDNSQ